MQHLSIADMLLYCGEQGILLPLVIFFLHSLMARASLLRVGCPEEGWERWSLEHHGECCLLRVGLRQEEPGGRSGCAEMARSCPKSCRQR